MSTRILELSPVSVFRPGTDAYPAYTVSNVRVVDGMMMATVRGGYPVDSPNATDRPAELSVCSDLQAGEALTHPGVGTFTLLYVNPIVIPFESGSGPIATLEFAPAPGFDTYWDQEKESESKKESPFSFRHCRDATGVNNRCASDLPLGFRYI